MVIRKVLMFIKRILIERTLMKEKQVLQTINNDLIKFFMAALSKVKYYINAAKYLMRTRLQFFAFIMFPRTKEEIINKFHNLYYDSNVFGGTWRNTKFLGVPALKCPFDLFVYQEILFELKPDVIIEAGAAFGGGAYYFV